MVLPDEAVPDAFFDECEQDAGEEDDQPAFGGEDPLEERGTGLAFVAVDPDQRHVGDAVGHHVQEGEGEVAVEDDYADGPVEGGGEQYQVFGQVEAFLSPLDGEGNAERREQGDEDDLENQGEQGKIDEHKIFGCEPDEVLRAFEVPDDYREDREKVNEPGVGLYDPAGHFFEALVDLDETVLLPDKMENGEVGEDAPEQFPGNFHQHDAGAVGEQGNEDQQLAVEPACLRIKISTEQRGIDVGNIDAKHEDQPVDHRRFLVAEEITGKDQHEQDADPVGEQDERGVDFLRVDPHWLVH